MAFDPVDFARQNIKYFTQKEDPESKDLSRINYLFKSDGVWEIRKSKIGVFTVHRFIGPISGFPEDHNLEEGFELALPKIPRRYLDQIISFFRKLTEEHDFEAYVQIFWDPKKEQYFLHCPEQEVSKGRVEYKPSDLIVKNILVCEIHSHNSMPAFFSPTDDKDEKKRGDRFFGVIGKLDTLSPQMKLSFIVGGGKRVFIEVEDLFEGESFPEEWLEKITYLDRKKNKELAVERSAHQFSYQRRLQDQREVFFGDEEEEEDDEEDLEFDDSEDIYDNMEMVTIEDMEQLAEWTGDPSVVTGAINHVLNKQNVVGGE